MKLTLHTETVIDSCHHLEGYDGKCARQHGHTSKIEAWFRGESNKVDGVGILVDFGILKEIKNKLDHFDLNEVIGKNSTAETMCQWIYTQLKGRVKMDIEVKVRYYETAVEKDTWCECGDWE